MIVLTLINTTIIDMIVLDMIVLDMIVLYNRVRIDDDWCRGLMKIALIRYDCID